MTVISEQLSDVAGQPETRPVTFFVPKIRENGSGSGTVGTIRVDVHPVDGLLTTPDLDPGEVDVVWRGTRYRINVPASAVPVRLWPLIENSVPYAPPVVSLVKQYRDEAVGSKDAAIMSAFHAQQSEQEARRLAEEAANTVTGVVSIDGKQGAVTKAALGIDRLDNTRDVEKPVSTAVENRFAALSATVDGTFTDVVTALATKQDATQVQAIAVSVAAAKIAEIVGNAPDALDTVYELSAALGGNPNFAAEVLAAIALKSPLASPNFSGTPTIGGVSIVKGDDAKLYDDRTPKAHSHSVTDIATGVLPVARGGIGRGALVDGAFFRATGTDAVQMRTPAQVLADIGAGTSNLALGSTNTTALRGDAFRVVASFPATGDDGVLYMTVE